MAEEYIITPDDFLYRRFPINNPNFCKLDINGHKVPTSAAFKTKPAENGLSVDIATLTTPEKSIMDATNFGLAELPASIPLSLNFPCKHDPLPHNDAHALILGENTKAIAKQLSYNLTQIFIF